MFGQRTTRVIDGVEYAPGAKFRVITEGARLTGWQSTGRSSWRGWKRDLHVGDVIECDGYGPGFGSDPGYGVEFKDPEVGRATFSPLVGGAFNYHPASGFLEPVEQTATV